MKTAMIGIGLILMGVVALYQMRNGALLAAYQNVYYSPPEPSEIAPAFAQLAETSSTTSGVTLGDVATARLICAESLLGAQPPIAASLAFQRLNLMILGAGHSGRSPVIDPAAHYVVELRGDLGRDTAVYRTTPLSTKRAKALVTRLGDLAHIDHPAYEDLRLTLEQHRGGVMVLVEALISGAEPFHECVINQRG